MGGDVTDILRRDAIVFVGCGALLMAVALATDVGHTSVAIALGLASLLALGGGLVRGQTWYRAGHWLAIAAVAVIAALTPTESLLEVSVIMVVVGIADVVIAPLYRRMQTAGENLLQ